MREGIVAGESRSVASRIEALHGEAKHRALIRLERGRVSTFECGVPVRVIKDLLRNLASPRLWASSREPLELDRASTHEEYAVYRERTRKALESRRQVEAELIQSHAAFHVPGWCFVCRAPSRFLVEFTDSSVLTGYRMPNWREHLTCSRCGLNNRMRAAIHIFEQECGPTATSRIYVTEQATSLFRVLKQRYDDITGSEYLGKAIPLGSSNQSGIRNESIGRLTFAGSNFDYILSFDVLEHVPDYLAGFAECFRCLKRGGFLLFSVPFTAEVHTLTRAQVNVDGTIKLLLPAEYHGDPLRSEGCLCFYHFGWDLLGEIRAIGFCNVQSLIYWSRVFGYVGNSHQMIFLAQKR